jgi:hypothetical protein
MRKSRLRKRVPSSLKSVVDFIEFAALGTGVAGNIGAIRGVISAMSRAQPNFSPTDQHARRIAAAIARGWSPVLTPELDLYLESSPQEIFVAFEGAARHMPPAGKDEKLAFGYLFILQQLLEHLRYRTDRGYADAASLIADFQAEVASRGKAGRYGFRPGRSAHQAVKQAC